MPSGSDPMGRHRFDRGSHATPTTTAATTATLRGNISHISGGGRRVTERAWIGPRALGLASSLASSLHRPWRVTVDASGISSEILSGIFLGDLMLRTRCFARHVFRKRGRSGGDESGGRKCDDCSLHPSSSLFGTMSCDCRSWIVSRFEISATCIRKDRDGRVLEPLP